MVYDSKMNSQTLIKFMERLIKDSKKKVFLILDNLKVHHSHMVVDWLKEHKKQIEVFHLPAYSPELNPIMQIFFCKIAESNSFLRQTIFIKVFL